MYYTSVSSPAASTGSARLVRLSHHRWAVPVLAELHRRDGSRLAPLANGLGVPRDTLTRTFEALIELGLAARNPGHGHPLRPEYVLSGAGRRAGPPALELATAARELGMLDLAGRKWSLPALAALDDGAGRFGTLLSALPGCTPRALALALHDLGTARLVERRVVDGRPPGTTYSLAPDGARLARLAVALADALRGQEQKSAPPVIDGA